MDIAGVVKRGVLTGSYILTRMGALVESSKGSMTVLQCYTVCAPAFCVSGAQVEASSGALTEHGCFRAFNWAL